MGFLQQIDIALVSTALVAVLMGIICLMLVRRLRRTEHRLVDIQTLLEQSQSDVAALCTGAVGVARRINRIEGKLRIQNERQDQLELHEPNHQVYGQAVRMARKGADLDELVSTCGLSRGEAELIVLLNNGAVQH